MNGKAQLTGQAGDFLTDRLSTLDAVRREEVVQRRVTGVFQGFQGRFLGEVVNVPVQLPTFQKRPVPQHRLYAQIQRDMEYLQRALWPDSGQKAEIVLDVFNDIEDQH